MQYRTFGQLDWKPSALGFGAMRLPTTDDDPKHINEPLATKMIHYAIDHGVNYVDTAWPYHQEASEPFLGRVLQGGYREKVRLATKSPCWLLEKPEDFDHYLGEQLKRLQTDHIDFYLLHALNEERWQKMLKLDIPAQAERAIADGRIRYLGFSFHDEYPVFKRILDDYDGWTFCQIQYNYMDVNYQAGTKGLKYAADKGLAVVIMEGLRGGQLAQNPPPDPVAEIWAESGRDRKPAEWGLQWLWNQPEVSVVLSGMSEMQHVTENVASADRSGVGTLTDEDLGLIERVRATYEALAPIPCTGCGYCVPCPNGVDIPTLFRTYNEAMMYDDVEGARRTYNTWIKEEQRANMCVECGTCQEKCPQGLEIIEWLQKVHAELSTAA
ncbi:MAG: aldo/keto reductase [Anaerolineae bacterium]